MCMTITCIDYMYLFNLSYNLMHIKNIFIFIESLVVLYQDLHKQINRDRETRTPPL